MGSEIVDDINKLIEDLRSRLEQAERERDAYRAELERSRMNQHEQGDDLTTVYMVGKETGKDMVKADLERAQAEAAAMREENSGLRLAFARLGETLKGLKDSYVLVDGDPSKGVISSAAMYWVEDAILGCSFAEGMAADWHKLWEIKRLAREYMAAVLARRNHRGVSVEDFANAAYDKVVGAEGPLAWRAAGEASKDAIFEWSEVDKRLAAAKRAAGEALFAALGKEAE